MGNSLLVQEYIDQIWNKQHFEKLDDFLHVDYKDHSLPKIIPSDMEGTKQWILSTGNSFEHFTVIEDQVTEGEKSMVKIRMNLKHIGPWRGIEATGIELFTIGYRYFRFENGKILEHWAVIDGQMIENQITNNSHGCEVK